MQHSCLFSLSGAALSLLKRRNDLGKVKEQNFVKVQRLWVAGQVLQPCKVSVFWAVSPHTEGDVREYRRCTQPSACCPPLPRDGDFRMRSRQAKEKEEMLHGKPRLNNVFGVDRDGAVPGVFPLRKSSPENPENPDAEPDLTHIKLRAEALHC